MEEGHVDLNVYQHDGDAEKGLPLAEDTQLELDRLEDPQAPYKTLPGDWAAKPWERPVWALNWHPKALDDLPKGARVVHLGDLHLGRRWLNLKTVEGVNLREQDIYDSARLLVESVRLDNPDVIVIAGDLFNTMDPTARTYAEVYALILELKKIAPVMIVAGNHDHKRSSTLSPLVHLRDFFGCDLHLTQGHSDYAGVRFHTLPYVALENAADDREAIRPFETTGRDILVAHAYVWGDNIPDLSRFEHVVVPEGVLLDPRLDRVLLGHVHKHTILRDGGNAYYCGPLQPLDYGEQDVSPGYWLHIVGDSETHTFDRPLPYRPFYLWEFAQGDMSLAELSRMVTSSLSEQAEVTDFRGAFGELKIVHADGEIRQSALPQAWQKLFQNLGGLYLKFDATSKEGHAGVLDTTYDTDTGIPTNLTEAYYDELKTQGHPELVALAKEILEPLMLKAE